MGRRDRGPKEKYGEDRDAFVQGIVETLEDIQQSLFNRAKSFRDDHTQIVESREAFYTAFQQDDAGFVIAHCNMNDALADQLQRDLKVTARCIPLSENDTPGNCIFSGQPAEKKIVFARSY